MPRTHTPILRILAVAAILLVLAVVVLSTVAARAQTGRAETGQEVRVTELERRQTATDSEGLWTRGELAKLSERLTRVETLGQNNNTLLLAVLAALAIQLIERAIRIGVGKRSS